MYPRIGLIISALILMLIGLVMIYSASSISAMDTFGDSAYYLKHQLVFILVGSIFCAAVARVPYRTWVSNIAWILWVVEVLLLVLTAALGYVSLGAQRWVSLPVIGAVQPSELAKIVVILVLALLIVRYHESVISLKRFICLSSLAIGVPCLLIVAQPDLGTTIIVASAALFALWFGEIDFKPILGAIILIVIIGVIFIFTSDERTSRVVSMLNPWADPQGSGYQAINSLYAFGSGGIFGVGLGNSRQKYSYLPEAHTDFIFSIIGEELGLFGAFIVLLLFVVFILSGVLIARNASTLSGRIIAGACTCCIGLQAFINIACTLGIFPITGKPLPFVSAGGSSLVATLLLLGLILSVSFRSTEEDPYEVKRNGFLVLDGGGVGKPDTSNAAKTSSSKQRSDTSSGRGVESAAQKRKSSTADSQKRKSSPSATGKQSSASKEQRRRTDGDEERSAQSSSAISKYSTHRHKTSTIELADSTHRRRNDK